MSRTFDCRNCSDSDPGAWHALDEFCRKLADQVETAARELYGEQGGKLRLEDAEPDVQESYRAQARRRINLEYASRLDGSVMPAPRVLRDEFCWCGGEVGARVPGDHLGLGCLANVSHNWIARGDL